MPVKSFLALLIPLQAFVTIATAQTLPGDLPDPLVFNGGSRVSSPEQWPARRDEMRELLLQYEYGHVPPPPGNVALDATLETGTRFEGASEFRALRLRFGPEQKLTTALHLYLPANVTGPLPVIVRFGLGGEHAPAANARGYTFACFEQTSLDPDTEGHDEAGPAQAAYPDHDWGSLAVWAWGASRVLDYLETLPEINAKQAVITGHSRTGKAALLAGALDDRFSMVVPNGSGAGGAALFRHKPNGVETLELITQAKRFKSWFQAEFSQFADRESALPFDQHFLRALVAPRTVLSTDAFGDQWANPEGTQYAWMAAQPAFDFLGVSANNLIHIREGGHDQLAPDFAVLLDVADCTFRNAAPRGDLRQAPFPKNE